MKKTKAPHKTPSPNREDSQVQTSTPKVDSSSAVFVSMALDMSWRLAIVVLVPIIGGFELDKRLHTTPLLTIIGFVLAMIGMGIVMWQTLQEANQMPVESEAAAKKPKKERR